MTATAGRPDRLAAIAGVREASARANGVTDPATRGAARERLPLPDPLGRYLDKVRYAAWSVTDDDVSELRSAGRSDEAVVELTIAAAMGEAGRRHDAVLRALRPEG